jgi:hypothetical protein
VIDFRYHLVSIVAVFLALAIGLVLGATQLKPLTQSTLDSQSNTEQHQISNLRAQNRSLQDQVGSAQQFAQAAAPRLLPGLLTGQRVVLVTAPGADGPTVSGISTALAQAGAKVTGQVGLQGAFFDTSASTESSLSALARQLAPDGVVPGSSVPPRLAATPKISGQLQAAQVLAAALVTPVSAQSYSGSTDLPASQVLAILNGFANPGYLHVSPAAGTTALEQSTLAVVVIPASPPQDGAADPANLALISVAYQLSKASRGVVLAGPLAGSGQGSAIDELASGDTGVQQQLSSVDDADREQGQIIVAQALAALVAGQKPSAYGVSPGVVPSPAPTASPAAKLKSSG